MSHLDKTFGEQITALLYVINKKVNDTIGDQEVLTYRGESEIYEEMEGLKFKIGPKSFYKVVLSSNFILLFESDQLRFIKVSVQ